MHRARGDTAARKKEQEGRGMINKQSGDHGIDRAMMVLVVVRLEDVCGVVVDVAADGSVVLSVVGGRDKGPGKRVEGLVRGCGLIARWWWWMRPAPLPDDLQSKTA